MHSLVNSFNWGFLSDRIVEALSLYSQGKPLSKKQKEALEEGIAFFKTILSGRKQITTENFESNALESIKIYNKSISVILEMPEVPQRIDIQEIQNTLEKLENNLSSISQGKTIPSREIKKTLSFFQVLQKVTLDDSSTIMNDIYESRSGGQWESVLWT